MTSANSSPALTLEMKMDEATKISFIDGQPTASFAEMKAVDTEKFTADQKTVHDFLLRCFREDDPPEMTAWEALERANAEDKPGFKEELMEVGKAARRAEYGGW